MLFFPSDWNPYLSEGAVGFSLSLDRGITYFVDFSGEEAFGFRFPFPGKVRLGSVQDQSAGLVDHLGEEAVGFLLPSFPDKGMTSLVDFLGKEAVGFPFLGKVRLGSGKEAAGFLFLVWFHEHSTYLAEL